MLTAQPQESTGRVLLEKLVTEFAEKAGVRQRYAVSPGTLVCPRLSRDGRALWVVVNMDGKGGSLVLSGAGRDALGGGEIPSGRLELGRYEYRLLWT
jgi:beta-galactosidase